MIVMMDLARSVVCFSTQSSGLMVSEVGSMNFDHAMSVLRLRFFRARIMTMIGVSIWLPYDWEVSTWKLASWTSKTWRGLLSMPWDLGSMNWGGRALRWTRPQTERVSSFRRWSFRWDFGRASIASFEHLWVKEAGCHDIEDIMSWIWFLIRRRTQFYHV